MQSPREGADADHCSKGGLCPLLPIWAELHNWGKHIREFNTTPGAVMTLGH